MVVVNREYVRAVYKKTKDIRAYSRARLNWGGSLAEQSYGLQLVYFVSEMLADKTIRSTKNRKYRERNVAIYAAQKAFLLEQR